MGTRNLTIVYVDGEFKVAQYGQGDGDPHGQGITALSFLRDKMDLAKFKAALHNSSYISNEKLNALWKPYSIGDNGIISLEGAAAMKRDHPEYSRDTGAKILELVQNSPGGLELDNQLNFAADGLSCK